MIKTLLFFAAMTMLATMSSALIAQPADIAPALKAAVNGPQRDAANRLRDLYRHPAETLAFFGIRDDMTVVEIAPGGGWYSEILGPLLREKGKLILAGSASPAPR